MNKTKYEIHYTKKFKKQYKKVVKQNKDLKKLRSKMYHFGIQKETGSHSELFKK